MYLFTYVPLYLEYLFLRHWILNFRAHFSRVRFLRSHFYYVFQQKHYDVRSNGIPNLDKFRDRDLFLGLSHGLGMARCNSDHCAITLAELEVHLSFVKGSEDCSVQTALSRNKSRLISNKIPLSQRQGIDLEIARRILLPN